MKKVLVAGSIVLDLIMTLDPAVKRAPDELFRQGKTTYLDGLSMYLGGEVGNTGLALHKMGLPVKLITKVGNDRMGLVVQEILREFGADTRIVTVDNYNTTTAVAITPPGMDKISFIKLGAGQAFEVEDVPSDLLQKTDLFQFGYPPAMHKLYANSGAGLEALFAKAQAAGATTSVDMTMIDLASDSGRQDWNAILPRMLKHVDIYLPSIEETLFLMDRERYLALAGKMGSKNLIDGINTDEITSLADRLLAMGPAIVVIKMGKKGLYLRTGSPAKLVAAGRSQPQDIDLWANRELWCEAIDTQPIVSTTGAGDTAIAGFLAALLHGSGPELALKMASLAASVCIGSPDTVSHIESFENMKSRLSGPIEWLPAGLDNRFWHRLPANGLFTGQFDR